MWLDVIEYYKDELITQYRNRTKMRGTVGALADCSVCEGLPLELQTAFDIRTAYGHQLDVIGRIVGVPRNVLGLDLAHTFFSFTRYAGSPASVGFSRYSDSFTPSTPLFLRYRSNASYTMTDYEFRAAIWLKIIVNTRPENYYMINGALKIYFMGDIYVSPGVSVMSVVYYVKAKYQNMFTSMAFLGLIPVPMGVSYTVSYT
jgi:hypothetical protein